MIFLTKRHYLNRKPVELQGEIVVRTGFFFYRIGNYMAFGLLK